MQHGGYWGLEKLKQDCDIFRGDMDHAEKGAGVSVHAGVKCFFLKPMGQKRPSCIVS